jgi:hypothetical protein
MPRCQGMDCTHEAVVCARLSDPEYGESVRNLCETCLQRALRIARARKAVMRTSPLETATDVAANIFGDMIDGATTAFEKLNGLDDLLSPILGDDDTKE